MKKKIAENINIRINIGNYQYIDITKYAEKEISYENETEMVEQEDKMTDELLENMIRNMRRIPDRLGKSTNAVVEVEQAITKEIPRWLENDTVANVPNMAKKIHNKVVSEQKEYAVKNDVESELDEISKPSASVKSDKENIEDTSSDLF